MKQIFQFAFCQYIKIMLFNAQRRKRSELPACTSSHFICSNSHRTGSQLYQQDVILGEKYAFIQYPGGTLSERLS